jgi:DMSO/TMAO reductase YedYZ molybdopterin-dependent catalytic subunit
VRAGTRGLAALAGVAAAVVALGVAQLVALALGSAVSAPLVAVGSAVIDAVPEPVKELAIRLFGTNDKLALQIGTLIVLLAFAALVGVLAVRNRAYGLVGVALFGLVGAIAAATRHGAGWTAVLPSLVGALAAAATLLFLLTRLERIPEPARTARSGEDGVPRRRFLSLTGSSLVAGAIAALGGRWLGNQRNVSAERAALKLPAPASPAAALPAEVNLGVPGLSTFITPNADFYRIDTALVVPQVDPNTWTLRIHGRVRNPMTLTYAQLLARPMIERYITLCCVSNEVGGDLISNARWLGVPVKSLLDEAQPEDGADQVVGRSVDGFTTGTPTAVLRDGRDAMLAIAMNGEPLPVEHGFPVRMVVPGLYGYVSATKWLVELELSSFADFDAYWIPRGWAQQAPIKTESRIDTPRNGDRPRAGHFMVAGVAWAQHRGVNKVELRIDDGPWQTARLSAVPSIDTWRQWTYAWDATPGTHRLTVRATDGAGAVQTEDEEPPAPDGASGWHTIEVTVQ